MNFVLFIALLALLFTTTLVSSGEDDYDPCKAAAFVNGDVAITKYELLRMRRSRRAASSLNSHRWKHGIIPYQIHDTDFTGDQKSIILEAMRHWENNSCLTFVEHSSQKDYIFFIKGSCGCCSYVGRKGNGKQGISIGEDCDNFGIIVHEIGHALGFWHEHTRPDRNDYVKILKDNIEKGKFRNFVKLNHADVNSYGEKYDFGSIMHYARNLFSKKDKNIIIPKVNISKSLLQNIGQRKGLSEGDIIQINKMYKCPKCGGTLQKPSGTISSPGYPSIITKPHTCVWRISTIPGEVIVLNVKEFDLISSKNCNTDFVEIRDGHGPKSRLIGIYCGSNRPPREITSTGSRLWVKMRLKSRSKRKGFLFSYKAVCGGVIKLDKGEIQSPNYPASYRYNKRCDWKITVKEGTKVGIKFSSFDVEQEKSCSYDALSIFDGHDESNMLARLCGRFSSKDLPKGVITSSNNALVRFESDNSVDGRGFMLNFFSEVDECEVNNGGCEHNCQNTIGSYKCFCNRGYELHSNGKDCEVACGGELKDRNGTITSPSYPDQYPVNKKCVWSIKAPPLHKIKLSFKEFELEESAPGCHYDYLVVKNKKNTTRLCGKKNPGVMMSTSNEMHLEFYSDNSMSMKGFAVEYHTDKDECQVSNGGCEHDCVNLIGGYTCKCRSGFMLDKDKHKCIEDGRNALMTAATGTITSPGYPSLYGLGLNLKWNIIVTPGHRIKLTFLDFSLEYVSNCEYDYVVVESGFKATQKKLCGTNTSDIKPVISKENKMMIRFHTDASQVDRGFSAVYKTVCGGRLHAASNSQLILSHVDSATKPYDPNTTCEWHLAAKDGYAIKIKFDMFELQDDGCIFDFVRITDGSNENAPEIARLCGKQTGKELQSTGNNMWILFQTDGDKAKKGFAIDYVRVKL